MKLRLVILPEVQLSLRSFPPQTKRYIRQALLAISQNPESGKPLREELSGFYSFPTKRFRIVYQIQSHAKMISVVGIGPRATIYEELGDRFKSI